MHSDTDSREPGHRRIGCLLLIRNSSGRVLLVKPSYRPTWQPVGGGAQPDETPWEAARREAAEETGIPDPHVGDLLIVDYTPRSPVTGTVEGYNFLFDGGVLPDGTDIVLPDARPGQHRELTDWQFVPPERLGDYCNAAQHRRMAAALKALADPRLRRILIEGQPVTGTGPHNPR
ncbi:NUDIX domain-containing protein [Streptomyces albus]|uniref:NUDIX domain-containing protein n=1 Tax=Streptomyces sp. PHES57 TaxID=2872626 RepID=UPI001CED4EAA|nr:NUDIX hydrolase [Streptomyces sp. PHES57]